MQPGRSNNGPFQTAFFTRQKQFSSMLCHADCHAEISSKEMAKFGVLEFQICSKIQMVSQKRDKPRDASRDSHARCNVTRDTPLIGVSVTSRVTSRNEGRGF